MRESHRVHRRLKYVVTIPVNAPHAFQKRTVRRSWCIARLNKSSQIPVSAPVHTLPPPAASGRFFGGASQPTSTLLDTVQNFYQLFGNCGGFLTFATFACGVAKNVIIHDDMS